jgi:hypothetical protein
VAQRCVQRKELSFLCGISGIKLSVENTNNSLELNREEQAEILQV